MNARKALLVLGMVVVAFIAAIIAVALFTIHKMESEKNRAKTEKARQNRWARTQEAFEETSGLKVTPDGVVKPDDQEGNENTETKDQQPD